MTWRPGRKSATYINGLLPPKKKKNDSKSACSGFPASHHYRSQAFPFLVIMAYPFQNSQNFQYRYQNPYEAPSNAGGLGSVTSPHVPDYIMYYLGDRLHTQEEYLRKTDERRYFSLEERMLYTRHLRPHRPTAPPGYDVSKSAPLVVSSKQYHDGRLTQGPPPMTPQRSGFPASGPSQVSNPTANSTSRMGLSYGEDSGSSARTDSKSSVEQLSLRQSSEGQFGQVPSREKEPIATDTVEIPGQSLRPPDMAAEGGAKEEQSKAGPSNRGAEAWLETCSAIWNSNQMSHSDNRQNSDIWCYPAHGCNNPRSHQCLNLFVTSHSVGGGPHPKVAPEEQDVELSDNGSFVQGILGGVRGLELP